MTLTPNFKPCPFCGRSKVSVAFTQHNREQLPPWLQFYGFCKNCGTSQEEREGVEDSINDAVSAWNKRAGEYIREKEFGELVEDCRKVLGEYAQPWPPKEKKQ